MNFDIREKVRVVRMAGENGTYHYGYSLLDIPLGTHGRVINVDHNRVLVKIEEAHYTFLPSELVYDYAADRNNKEASNQLENLLSIEESLNLNESKNGSKNTRILKRFFNILTLFFSYSTTQEEKPFEPRFNVREEFAVWIRQEFPELKSYAGNDKKYVDLVKRKNEIMKGARMAYDHAMKTTGGCARTSFMVSFGRLARRKKLLKGCDGCALDRQEGSLLCYHMTEEDRKLKNNGLFPKYLEEFVETIERSSANLDSKYGKHYGTKLPSIGEE